jgi:inhibitor of cysteine peptidase
VSELVLTELDNNQSFDLQVGTPVSIRLPENPATGYRWSVESLDENLVSVDGSEFSQAPESGVGGGGIRTFKLRPKAPGVTHVTLENKRPWEGDAPAVGQFEVTLRISP